MNIEQKLAAISDEEIKTYLRDHEAEVESSLALQSIDLKNFDLNAMEVEVLNQALNSISDDEILNYNL
jgi:hypothetical protein